MSFIFLVRVDRQGHLGKGGVCVCVGRYSGGKGFWHFLVLGHDLLFCADRKPLCECVCVCVEPKGTGYL